MKKNYIQSIERASDIIKIISKNQNIGLTEISKLCELHKSTVYNILVTLEKENFIEQDINTGKYSLGIKMLEYGKIYENNYKILPLIRVYLEYITNEFSETSYIAVKSKNLYAYVDKIEPDRSLKSFCEIGYSNSFHNSAMGKIFLSFVFTRYINELNFDNEDKRLKLKEELEVIKIEKVAYDFEEYEKGQNCIAFPVFNKKNKFIAGIGMSGPSSRLDINKMNIAKKKIFEYTDELKNKLE
ncbi:IclR family transcriptional regulator [Candidatus Gracilibacteria bacterium]|nr:IclR family transcriptional regulator [Candidatus Gracilibacteria bacterium]